MPSSSISTIRSLPSTSSSKSGLSDANEAKASASPASNSAMGTEIFNRPAMELRRSRTSSVASWSPSINSADFSKKRCPSSVSASFLVVRWNNRTPNSLSKRCICLLTADGVISISRATEAKLPNLATRINNGSRERYSITPPNFCYVSVVETQSTGCNPIASQNWHASRYLTAESVNLGRTQTNLHQLSAI